MSSSPRAGAHIVGCGQAPYTRHPAAAASTPRVLAQAAGRALRNAGIDAEELDGLALSSFSLGPDHAVDFAWRMGLRVR